LGKHQGGILTFTRLTSLSDTAAESLSKHKGDLWFFGLTSLSTGAAEGLSKHRGTLWIEFQTSLSDAAAEALSQHKGELRLGNLTNLSDAAAEALSRHEGKLEIGLDRFPSLSDRARQSLLAQQERVNLLEEFLLSSPGGDWPSELRPLTAWRAKKIAAHGWYMNLSGIGSLDVEIAAILSTHVGSMRLDGLEEASDEVITHLAQHRGELSLGGLQTLSETAAEALSKHFGRLHLTGITSLTESAAEHLVKHEAPLTISIEFLPREIRSILRQHPHLLGLRHADDRCTAYGYLSETERWDEGEDEDGAEEGET